jgi:hypothetical protein
VAHVLRYRLVPVLSVATVVLAGCASPAYRPPVIGAPTPSAATSATQAPGRSEQLRQTWQLTGVDLPSDWPEVPLPKGSNVASAYAVDSAPRRTWTASFVGKSSSTGKPVTALAMSKPVTKALLKAGYQPVSAYSAPGDANAGLFSFAGKDYSVYLVLGDLDGHPNIVMTVRQRDPGGASASATWPTPSAALPSVSPSSVSPSPASATPAPTSTTTPSASAVGTPAPG